MTRFSRQCWAVARRDAALHRSYGWSLWLGLATAALGLLSYHFIGKLVAPDSALLPGGDYFAFVWLGVTLQLWVTAWLGALGSALPRHASEGTLESSIAAGASPLALLIGSALLPTALALVQVGAYLALGLVAFRIDLDASGSGVAALAAIATLLACAPIGFFAAGVWLRLRRAGWVISGALLAFGVLGGVYFPVALLPAPWEGLAEWVPLQVGLTAARSALLEGADLRASAEPLLRLLALALVTLPLSGLWFEAAWRRAERRGDLALA